MTARRATGEGRPPPEGPLAGLRVLDLSRFLSGPFCTQLLADYGADVVSVESPRGRELQGPGARDSYFFLSAHRGKRSLALDLKQPAGREVLARLLERADVLVENYRPGVLAALGFEPAALLARHPRLILCSISGFGADGPYASRPGFDPIAQAMSGLMSLTGTEESGPTRVGIAISDLLAGIFAAHGIQLALLVRERTGRGQLVDTSLLEATIGVLSWGAGMYFESGRSPGVAGHHHPLTAPAGRFRARDGYFIVAAASDAIFDRLALAVGHSEWLLDERFQGVVARMRNRPALFAALDEVFGAQDVAHWVETLNAAGVPAGPVLGLADVFADPQVLAREMLVTLPHPERETFLTTGLPVKLSETPGAIRRAPPLHGEHTGAVLREAGYRAAEIDVLAKAGVIGLRRQAAPSQEQAPRASRRAKPTQ